MRYFVLALFALTPALVSNLALAETSAERAKIYFSDIENGRYAAAVGHFDPVELKEFRKTMEFYKEIPPQAQAQFVQTFYGASQTIESLGKASDVEFFTGLFNFIMGQADAAGGLSFDGLEILGEVMEGKNVSHLVIRNRVSVGEIEMEAMEVISLQKVGKEWRVLMSGKIKGLPQQLEAAFAGQ